MEKNSLYLKVFENLNDVNYTIKENSISGYTNLQLDKFNDSDSEDIMISLDNNILIQEKKSNTCKYLINLIIPLNLEYMIGEYTYESTLVNKKFLIYKNSNIKRICTASCKCLYLYCCNFELEKFFNDVDSIPISDKEITFERFESKKDIEKLECVIRENFNFFDIVMIMEKLSNAESIISKNLLSLFNVKYQTSILNKINSFINIDKFDFVNVLTHVKSLEIKTESFINSLNQILQIERYPPKIKILNEIKIHIYNKLENLFVKYKKTIDFTKYNINKNKFKSITINKFLNNEIDSSEMTTNIEKKYSPIVHYLYQTFILKYQFHKIILDSNKNTFLNNLDIFNSNLPEEKFTLIYKFLKLLDVIKTNKSNESSLNLMTEIENSKRFTKYVYNNLENLMKEDIDIINLLEFCRYLNVDEGYKEFKIF